MRRHFARLPFRPAAGPAHQRSWRKAVRPKPVALTPTLTGQVEYCLTCHSDLAQISNSHPVQTFGCVLCHGGERLALDANLAHSTMRGGRNPSDFSVVQASCGGENCHSGSPESYNNHIQRATTSIQATYAGAIASILYTFGAQPDLNARFGISCGHGAWEHQWHHLLGGVRSCPGNQSQHQGFRSKLSHLPPFRPTPDRQRLFPVYRLRGLPYPHPTSRQIQAWRKSRRTKSTS